MDDFSLPGASSFLPHVGKDDLKILIGGETGVEVVLRTAFQRKLSFERRFKRVGEIRIDLFSPCAAAFFAKRNAFRELHACNSGFGIKVGDAGFFIRADFNEERAGVHHQGVRS